MGTFYSLSWFIMRLIKKKGIVLTPNHVTRLLCDIAEYFRGRVVIDRAYNLFWIFVRVQVDFFIAALKCISTKVRDNDVSFK